ncbi:FG-GAP-like repeat-containing protein [Yeosuana sp. MJ-SS3]|uniref:FG-GAP-like repeat-containing protein n=1 Tax=Gilvirhabdus luticola TaxID=3079858 RepID=A0ABU3U986_9FLAO|nr:FG-GAP-like repeat-containing protein [Yeosuana sp. MJ-SS3]MDU8886889.1 FG-GAP-like repeat-containing protein [Yeosuana sp. MJ-SS3]
MHLKFKIHILFVFLASQLLYTQIYFEDVASTLGVSITGNSGTVLGGVSFYDFNNDGWDDLTFASKETSPVRFFKNLSGTFVEETFNITITGHSKQVLWVDYDNDGDNDLFVTKVNGVNALYQNNGSFVFSDVTTASGFPALTVLYTYGASFGDYDNDGFLDLFLCNKDNSYVIPNQLYHNNGNGTFTNVSAAAGISDVGHLSFCSSFFDYDNDGFQDIYISNDRFDNTNILYHNNQDGTFTDVSIDSGTNVAANAMSTTIDDYNDDGWLDIYVTNTVEGNYHLQNNGDGTFTDVASTVGTIFNSIGWGANFFDADNDSDMDLYVSSMVNNPGAGLIMSGFYECDQSYNYSIPSNAGFDNDEYISFSNAIGDINNDGYPDFVVSNQAPDNHTLWRNSAGSNNWLKVKLQGNASNRMGIGSWIEILVNGKMMYRYTLCGESFLGQNSGTEFFGVGNATNIDFVKVTWLSGIEDTFFNVTTNQVLNIVEGTGELSNEDFRLNAIKLVPNPTNGCVNVTNFEHELNIIVRDFLGRKIKEQVVNYNNRSIDLKELSKGVYFFVIENGNNAITKRVILN